MKMDTAFQRSAIVVPGKLLSWFQGSCYRGSREAAIVVLGKCYRGSREVLSWF